ncbi:hypothetical protein FDP41_011002 [Naegleria fowleri]|uniref:RRM Nup35-type domain-containing protein n=1 Tax=Naegleria fowleri TaxID=5763 RepID=A0A6A5C926_NAEFO|nr:uncharacterized protein FDP41_011002 [Naegleria fowleri]KAF0983024.1 hypothetical protein FDP41_011002 [Naegleria fowleri]
MQTPHLSKHRSVLASSSQQQLNPLLSSQQNKPKGTSHTVLPSSFINQSVTGKEPAAVSFKEPLISSSSAGLYRKNELSTSSDLQQNLIVDSEIPPTESIVDGLPNRIPSNLAPTTSSFIFGQSPMKPFFKGRNKRSIFTSPLQTDPFYQVTDVALASRINDIVKDTTWVTVFGFPPDKTSYILKQFSNYGTIINHKITNGNFIHIQYKTRIQADKALSKNGKIFDGVLMIGVVECLDTEILQLQQRERDSFESYAKKRTFDDHSEEEEESKDTFYRNGINFRHQLDLPLQKKRKPEASTSTFSKFLDYIFKF